MTARFQQDPDTLYPCWVYGFTVREVGRDMPNFAGVRDWCHNEFGPMSALDQGDAGDGYPTHWSNWGATFLLMRPEHAFAFKMRWG